MNVVKSIVVLSIIAGSIRCSGLNGAISNVPNRFALLDNECITQWKTKKPTISTPEDFKERMSDEELGMTEFVNKKLTPIGGIIRSTWSDYRILEIRARDQKVSDHFLLCC